MQQHRGEYWKGSKQHSKIGDINNEVNPPLFYSKQDAALRFTVGIHLALKSKRK